MTAAPLPLGYSSIASGQIANVVTCLEMLSPPKAQTLRPGDENFALTPWKEASIEAFRDLFRRVGQDWLWHSRLHMADEKLRSILDHTDVDLYRLMLGDNVLGVLELDFREQKQCELSFFGLVPEAIGKGAGRYLINRAIDLAWHRDAAKAPIERFWVHTCTFDHPNALRFYQNAGFVPYAFMVEVQDDPRLTGHLPRHVGQHVPLLDPTKKAHR